MVSFNVLAGIAVVAAVASGAAIPASSDSLTVSHVKLDARQADMPSECTEYCSVAAGCVCIIRPTNCVATYIVDSGETCGTVVERFSNFTATDLYKWNPEVGRSCFGLRAYVPVCIGVPNYSYPGPVKGGDIWTAEQTPVPLQPSIVANCTKYEYTDKSGSPILQTILSTNGITKQQWNLWNGHADEPDQDWASWAQYFSCVKA